MSADATTILEPPRLRGQVPSYVPPVGILILVLLPLLLLPLAAVFVFVALMSHLPSGCRPWSRRRESPVFGLRMRSRRRFVSPPVRAEGLS